MSGVDAPRADPGIDHAALDRWLSAHVAGYAGPPVTAKFAGGQSNPTYRIESPSGSYVLRRKPSGVLLPSAHAVDREYRVLRALHPTGFPVPLSHGLCTDDAVAGTMFYVMERVDGRTFWNGALPGMAPAERAAIYAGLIDALARLHAIDPARVGLSDHGRPGNYFARQVARWIKQYRATQTEPIEAMERLIDWLPAGIPVQERVAIVHGDYRIDNLLFAPDGARVCAVLDWELSTLGDPLADLTYLLMNWVANGVGEASIAGLDHVALGIPTADSAVARYCAATGRDGLPRLDWYFAYNLFRVAAILQGVRKRMIDGNASSATAAGLVARIATLAAQGWQFARRAGAGA